MGKDFENTLGIMTPKGQLKMMTAVIDGGVFPGLQGGPLEHVIAAKAVAFGEALQPGFKAYGQQVIANANRMAEGLISKGFHIISGGTENHSMLIDLRSKGITGKAAEACLGLADITVNKNMVPFDDKSPFVTSGIRVGTSAITTRGLGLTDIDRLVDFIDQAITHHDNEAKLKSIATEVKSMMSAFPLFAEGSLQD